MRLDDARVQTFLAGKPTVVLATVQADGAPLAMAMVAAGRWVLSGGQRIGNGRAERGR